MKAWWDIAAMLRVIIRCWQYALIVILLAIVFIPSAYQQQDIPQLERIERDRKALQDSVVTITARTRRRELQLKDAIRKDLALIDQLNDALSVQKNASDQLKERVRNRKKEIDRLWSDE